MSKIRPTEEEQKPKTASVEGAAEGVGTPSTTESGTSGNSGGMYEIDVDETADEVSEKASKQALADYKKQLDERTANAKKRYDDAQAEAEKPIYGGYEDWISKQSGETEEQKARREKRELYRRRLAAIADGISGMANIIGAAHGATPHQGKSLSEAERNRQQVEAARRQKASELHDKYVYYNEKNKSSKRKEAEDRAQKAYTAWQKSATDAPSDLEAYKKKLKDTQNVQSQIKAREAAEVRAEKKLEIEKGKADAYMSGVANQNQNRDKVTASIVAKNNKTGEAALITAKKTGSGHGGGSGSKKNDHSGDVKVTHVVENDDGSKTTRTYYEPKKPKRKIR